jgi:hypothetical protein
VLAWLLREGIHPPGFAAGPTPAMNHQKTRPPVGGLKTLRLEDVQIQLSSIGLFVNHKPIRFEFGRPLSHGIELSRCRGGGFLNRCMFDDEIDDRRGIIQSMRMMTNAGFGNQSDRTAQLAITISDQAGVFLPGNHIIGFAIHMQQGDFRGGK